MPDEIHEQPVNTKRGAVPQSHSDGLENWRTVHQVGEIGVDRQLDGGDVHSQLFFNVRALDARRSGEKRVAQDREIAVPGGVAQHGATLERDGVEVGHAELRVVLEKRHQIVAADVGWGFHVFYNPERSEGTLSASKYSL